MSGVFSGPAAPMATTIAFPNGFRNGLASSFQLFVIQMSTPGVYSTSDRERQAELWRRGRGVS